MSEYFENAAAGSVVSDLAKMMREQRDYLSEVDGAIGDGDHGINMTKGFSLAEERIDPKGGFHEAIKTLGRTLVMEIGGSMGPLYGGFFKAMARECKDKDQINAETFAAMLEAAYEQIRKLGDAKVGDKTLVDALDPAIAEFKRACDEGKSFSESLDLMTKAAEQGKDSTKDLVAKVGRSARLGERSRGVLDAGATSCWLILCTMSDSIKKVLV